MFSFILYTSYVGTPVTVARLVLVKDSEWKEHRKWFVIIVCRDETRMLIGGGVIYE